MWDPKTRGMGRVHSSVKILEPGRQRFAPISHKSISEAMALLLANKICVPDRTKALDVVQICTFCRPDTKSRKPCFLWTSFCAGVSSTHTTRQFSPQTAPTTHQLHNFLRFYKNLMDSSSDICVAGWKISIEYTYRSHKEVCSWEKMRGITFNLQKYHCHLTYSVHTT